MYYPLSQIKTNLYTNGDEFTSNPQDTTTSYSGFYWKTSGEEFFTGKTPQDKPNIPLFKISSVEEQILNDPLNNSNTTLNVVTFNGDPNLDEYLSLTKTPIDKINYLPYYNPQLPTQQDYQNGEFRRYFCKKTNEVIYLEIDQIQYTNLISKKPQILWQLYLPYNITWQLTGDKQQVAQVNKNIVELVSKALKLPNFNLYIKEDYIKYYQ
jgi:hypothetical protein